MAEYAGDFGGSRAGHAPKYFQGGVGLGRIFWGTSSWNYEGWEGLVYRDVSAYGKHFTRDSIREYVQHEQFDCVGIDRFFYGPPSERVLATLRSRLPVGFPAIIKSPRELTYPVGLDGEGKPLSVGFQSASFLNPSWFRRDFGEPFRRYLPSNVGAFVLQFPPHIDTWLDAQQFYGALDHFLGDLSGTYPVAIEIRKREWLTSEYFAILAAHRTAHVFQVWTDMPLPHQVIEAFPESLETAPFLVCRALVRPAFRYKDAVDAFYPYRELRDPRPEIRNSIFHLFSSARSLNVPVYTTVNNRLEGCAPLTVSEMRSEWEWREDAAPSCE